MTSKDSRGDDWRDKTDSLSEQFCYMLHNNIRTDCTFIVGTTKQEKFQCHKLQLCRASSVFDSMLYGPMSEKGEIFLTNIQPETFKRLLKYIYTDKLELLSAGAALSLCRAANLYKMSRLRDACELYLRDNLQTECLWPALEFSLQLPETNSLRDKCLEFLRNHTLACLQEKEFVSISRACLTLLLQQDVLSIDSELDLIRAAERWASHEACRLSGTKSFGVDRTTLGPSFSLLRFLSLSPEEFSTNLSNSNLLTDQEKLSILVNLNSPGKMPLPIEVCTKNESRKDIVTELTELPLTSKNNEQKSKSLKSDIPQTKNDLNSNNNYSHQNSTTPPTSQCDNNNSYKNYKPRYDNNLKRLSAKHFVCTRPTLDSSDDLLVFCKSPLESEIEFCVNVDIKVVGVEVSTQYIKNINNPMYKEDIIITIKNSKGCFYKSYYRADAYYNHSQFVAFDEPVSIRKNDFYHINVQYNVPEGRYLTPRRDNHVYSQGVHFKFNPFSKRSENVQSIVFY